MEIPFGAQFGYDTNHGVMKVMGAILEAEDGLRGDEDQKIAHFIVEVSQPIEQQLFPDILSDTVLRSSLGNPSPTEVEQLMAAPFPRWRSAFVKGFEDQEMVSKVREDFTDLRRFAEDRGREYSKPHLLALLITRDVGEELKELFWRPLIEDLKPPQFSPQRDLPDQAQAFLNEKRRSRSAEYGALLTKDTTGCKLVVRAVENLREELNNADDYPFCKEYVLAGAELARDVYLAVNRIITE